MARDGVVAAAIAFPVRVVGDVGSRDGDGVVVGVGVLRSRRRVAEVFDRDAVAAVGIDREDTADGFPDAGGALSVFL